MSLIVMDLEWNQSPTGPKGTNADLTCEIIEIGAVKLDAGMNAVSEYQALVCPKIYRKIQFHIREIVSHTEKELYTAGRPFPEVCREFLEWCGPEPQFCTWGTTDLYFLQENMDFYGIPLPEFPVRYFNVQQIYADQYSETGTVCKLEKAVEKLCIPETDTFHDAANDARYTARVMKEADLGDFSDQYSYDFYQYPENPDRQIQDRHHRVIDEITTLYPDRQSAFSDASVLTIACPVCGKRCVRRVKWFQPRKASLTGAGKCFLHGYAESVIHEKNGRHTDGQVFLYKQTRLIGKEELNHLRERRQKLESRKKGKGNAPSGEDAEKKQES